MPLWSNTGMVAARPTWANTDNSTLYGNTYPVLPAEVNATNSKVKGLSPGWVAGIGYVDSAGDARYKFETLVPMKSMANTTIYTFTALVGRANVTAASKTIRPRIIRTNTKLTGKIAINTTSKTVTGTGTKFQVECVANSTYVRYNNTYYAVVNAIASNTSMTFKLLPGHANANSLFFKIVDSRDSAFSVDVATGMQVAFADNSVVRVVNGAATNTSFLVNVNVGVTDTNTSFYVRTNVTGSKFFHA